MSDKTLRMQFVFDALDKLTGPLKDITSKTGKAKAALAATRQELREVAEAQRDLSKFKSLELGFQGGAKELSEAQKKVAALKKEIAATEAPTHKMTKALEQAEKVTRDLERRQNITRETLGELSAKMEKAGADITDLATHEERLARAADKAGLAMRDQEKHLDKVTKAADRAPKMKEFGSKSMSMGTAAIGAGAVIEAPVYLATTQAMALESAMADVKKVMSFTPEGLDRLNTDMLDMSTRVPLTVEGLTQIAAAAGRAGVAQDALRNGKFDVAREELLAFTEEAAKMGVAFDISAEDAGATMAKWRTAFGLGQDGITRLGDQINALTNRFGGSAADVTDMVTRIGPLGKVAGVASDEIASMAQLLNSIGVESEIGATGIKNMMLGLTKGTAATKQQSQAFAKLGLNAEKVAKGMQTDASGTIIDVMERINKLPKESQAGTLTQLFGSESVAAIAPMLTSLDQLKANFKTVGDQASYAGSMNAEYLSRIATTEGATGLAKNALSALNIEMGKGMLPTVSLLSEKTVGIANQFRKWAAVNPKLASGLMLFIAIGGALIAGLGALGVAVGAATFAFGALGISTWAALWPVLAIIAAIAAVIAVGYLLVTNWDKIWAWISKTFTAWWTELKRELGMAFDFILAAFMNFTPIGWVIKAMMPVLEFFAKIDWGKIGADIIHGLINGIVGMFGSLKNVFVNAASTGLEAFKKVLGIKSPSRVMMQMGGYVTDGLDAGVEDNQHKPLKRMQRLAASIAGAVAIGTAGAGAGPVAAAPRAAPPATAASPMGEVHIHVYAAPGQSAEDIAEEVARQLEKLKREGQKRARDAFRDDED